MWVYILFLMMALMMMALLLQAIYVFQKAAILSMLPEEEVTKLGENVVDLFRWGFFLCMYFDNKFNNPFPITVYCVLCRQVDGLRLKIAGKSIPTEKFAAKKAQRYASSNPAKLVVPALVRTHMCSSVPLNQHCFQATALHCNLCPLLRR